LAQALIALIVLIVLICHWTFCGLEEKCFAMDACPNPSRVSGMKIPIGSSMQGVCCSEPKAKRSKPGAALPDLTERLLASGLLAKYITYRDDYRRWRSGQPHGAQGEAAADALQNRKRAAWRDQYSQWRKGHACGARGETSDAQALPLETISNREEDASAKAESIQRASAVIYDVWASEAGKEVLIPVDGPAALPINVDDLPPDALITIRSFRFLEDRSDEREIYEQELRNVNSGSLLWLPIHLAPNMHSVRGAKYGKWFMMHYFQVYAKHFRSCYHMANDGCCYPATTFGATQANDRLITGKTLPSGYFWYVSPASGPAKLGNQGWQHICRSAPFDGSEFLKEWENAGSPMDARKLQEVLNHVTEP